MASQTNFAFSKSSPSAAADEVLIQILQTSGDPNLISFPVKNTGGIDARIGTSEAVGLASRGKLVTFNNGSAVAATLANPATLNSVFTCFVSNLGAGLVTLTPSAGTIDGGSSKGLSSGNSALVFSDGVNYRTIPINFIGTQYGELGVEIDGGGSVPPTGSKRYLRVPFDCTIADWTILADQAGSCQITVKKCAYSGFPTTASIVASAPPTLSAAQKATSATLTGWTTSLTKGDILEFNLDSVTSCQWLELVLSVTKS